MLYIDLYCQYMYIYTFQGCVTKPFVSTSDELMEQDSGFRIVAVDNLVSWEKMPKDSIVHQIICVFDVFKMCIISH